MAVGCYYVYVQSWTLAYTCYALFGTYVGVTSQEGMLEFLGGFQVSQSRWGVSGVAYLCFVLTMAFNT